MHPNQHVPTYDERRRVKDLVIAGIPKYIIAKMMGIAPDTLENNYSNELTYAQAEQVERIAKVVAIQAEGGDSKAQSLYLKTQGAKFGWVEKQVVENISSEDTQALKDKIKELEGKFDKDY